MAKVNVFIFMAVCSLASLPIERERETDRQTERKERAERMSFENSADNLLTIPNKKKLEMALSASPHYYRRQQVPESLFRNLPF